MPSRSVAVTVYASSRSRAREGVWRAKPATRMDGRPREEPDGGVDVERDVVREDVDAAVHAFDGRRDDAGRARARRQRPRSARAWPRPRRAREAGRGRCRGRETRMLRTKVTRKEDRASAPLRSRAPGAGRRARPLSRSSLLSISRSFPGRALAILRERFSDRLAARDALAEGDAVAEAARHVQRSRAPRRRGRRGPASSAASVR